MENLLFFLWLMFFPVMDDIGHYIKCKTNKKQDEEDKYEGLAALFMLAFYFIVAFLLYEY